MTFEFPVSALSLFSLAAVVILLLYYLRKDRRLDSIDGPKGHPIIGIGLGFPPRAADVFRQWAEEYGEIFKIRVGWYNWVVINSPEAMREIFDKQSVYTSSKPPAPILDGIVVGGMRMFTMPYGLKWRAYRTITHRLLAHKATFSVIPTQAFEIKQLMWDLAHNNNNHTEFYQHIRRTSFSIVMTSTYGRRIGHWDHEDVRHAIESTQILGKVTRPGVFIEDELPLLAQLPHWMQPSRKRAEGYAKPVLQAKMRLWNLMKAAIADGTAPPCFGKDLVLSDYKSQGLTDEDAAWIAGGLVEAGAETTTSTLNALVLYLAANPAVQQKAHEEVSRVVGDDRAPEFDDIERLPYIHACVKEVLRLRPVPVWGIQHYTDEDVVYKNHVIPKGTVVLANTAFIHYDPSRYQDPFAFQPERYIHHVKYAAEYAAMRDPYQRDHFTFGVGRRICPGSKMAENTLNLGLANMLWAFEIRPPVEIVDGREREIPIDVSDEAREETAFQAPKPFKARFIPRSKERLRIVEHNWQSAQETGYFVRGEHVDMYGIARPKQ